MSELPCDDFTEDFPTEVQYEIEPITERFTCVIFDGQTLLVMDEETGEELRVSGENMAFEEPVGHSDASEPER